jgi:hypothetical protein
VRRAPDRSDAIRAGLLVLSLALGSAPAGAGPREDAEAAYGHGDYAEAAWLARPSAERGDAAAKP